MGEIITAARPLTGIVDIPGDKSISHRAAMLAALAATPVRLRNFLVAEDCLRSLRCMQSLGAKITEAAPAEFIVHGRGLRGLSEPGEVLDAGNSGTTMRLLTGILACQPFFSVLSGDASLRRRPMARIITPLEKMGCRIFGRDRSRYAPLAVLPAAGIKGTEHAIPVASAQVKSALLLAGLFADSPTAVTEPALSRDHTERMFEAFGVRVERRGLTVAVQPADTLAAPPEIDIPGDISSAAFWLVAASLIPGSRLRLRNVGINPTRAGILECLTRMGAAITLCNRRQAGHEPVADILVEAAELEGIVVDPETIPRVIDEIPVLAVAALHARGRTVIAGAGELRVKESDRLRAIVEELGKMGAVISEQPDGFAIEGRQQLRAAACNSRHDHRMAMALAVAGMAARGAKIANPECVNISYPGFFKQITALQQD